MNAVVSEQGIIQGASHRTLRLRSALKSEVLIFADVGVKHAAPLADRGLPIETRDLTERGLADAIIVSGEMTGEEAKASGCGCRQAAYPFACINWERCNT